MSMNSGICKTDFGEKAFVKVKEMEADVKDKAKLLKSISDRFSKNEAPNYSQNFRAVLTSFERVSLGYVMSLLYLNQIYAMAKIINYWKNKVQQFYSNIIISISKWHQISNSTMSPYIYFLKWNWITAFLSKKLHHSEELGCFHPGEVRGDPSPKPFFMHSAASALL